MSTFDLNSIDEVITPCCDVEVKTSDIGDKLKCCLLYTSDAADE